MNSAKPSTARYRTCTWSNVTRIHPRLAFAPASEPLRRTRARTLASSERRSFQPATTTVIERPASDEPSMSQPAQQYTAAMASYKKGVVIVGGGPAGLAIALLLAKRGWQDVTIIEKRPDLQAEQADMSYVYMIDGRGYKLLQQIPGLDAAVSRNSVALDGSRLSTVLPNGTVNVRKLNIKSDHFTSRWLTRPKLLKILREDGLLSARAQGWGKHILLRTGTRVVSVTRERRQSGGWQAVVTVQDSNGQEEVLRPHLVVGADGLHSTIRAALVQWDQEDKEVPQPVAYSTAKGTSRFEMRKEPSPSAHLRFKVLRLPPNPILTKGPNAVRVPNEEMAIVKPRPGLSNTYRMRLGLLPLKDGTHYRTANIITVAEGHHLWTIKTADQLYKYFEDVFPQLPVRDLISQEEAARFAASTGGAFPVPQHVSGLQMNSPPGPGMQAAARASHGGSDITDQDALSRTTGREPVQGYGVILVGDARAAFPPDTGQGVNSAFEDVLTFIQAMDACQDNLTEALPQFEQARLDNIKALVELCTFAYPYQYSQDPFRQTLWTVNFVVRMLLNKLAPWFFSPSAFMHLQNPELSYRRIVEECHTTTRRLVATLFALVVVPALTVALPMLLSKFAGA